MEQKDTITGRTVIKNPLNKKKLTREELDDLLGGDEDED